LSNCGSPQPRICQFFCLQKLLPYAVGYRFSSLIVLLALGASEFRLRLSQPERFCCAGASVAVSHLDRLPKKSGPGDQFRRNCLSTHTREPTAKCLLEDRSDLHLSTNNRIFCLVRTTPESTLYDSLITGYCYCN
jgi:hypothetical protein